MYLFIAGFFGESLEYLIGWFTRFHYVAPFIVLLLCGLGAPLPEEITLIGCGYLLHLKEVGFVPITLVCSAAILIGDSIPYWLGRHYGLAALKTRWVAKVLHPERFAKIERRFEDNKNWSIFTCRFLPGLRIPGYFVAGTLRMSYARFIILDSLGVLLSVPTSIWVASLVFRGIEGEDEFGAAQKRVSSLNRYLLIGVAVLVVVIIVWSKLRKRAKERAARAAQLAQEVLAESHRAASGVPGTRGDRAAMHDPSALDADGSLVGRTSAEAQVMDRSPPP